MQAIRNIIDFIRTKLSGLTSASKLLVGALVVIIAMTFFLVAQYSSTKSMVVFEVLPTGRDEAKRFLGERAVVYEETGGQILVPVEQHAALVSGFTEAHGGASDLLDFNKLFESDNPFETGRRSEDKKHFALQNVLSRTITGFKGVKSATVVISQKPALTFGASSADRDGERGDEVWRALARSSGSDRSDGCRNAIWIEARERFGDGSSASLQSFAQRQ